MYKTLCFILWGIIPVYITYKPSMPTVMQQLRNLINENLLENMIIFQYMRFFMLKTFLSLKLLASEN